MRLNQKRKGKTVLPVLKDKNLWEKIGRKQKKIGWDGSVEERESQKAFEKFWNSEEHVKSLSF